MNLDTLQTLLPDLGEETLTGLLSAIEAEAEPLRQENQQLQAALTDTRYDAAMERATAGLRFSSRSAREAFLSALRQSALPVENGRLQGFEDFRRDFQEKDPEAFRAPVAPMVSAAGQSAGRAAGQEDGALRRALGLK